MRTARNVSVTQNTIRSFCRILLIVSILYGILLFVASEFQRTLFSVFTTIALCSLLESLFRKRKRFDYGAAVIAVVGAIAKIAWTILLNSVEELVGRRAEV